MGNTRAVFKNDGGNAATLIQANSYYPFGLEMPELSYVSGSGETKYKYNGKEMQDAFSLNWIDYGARFYDPQIGRWHVVDPMASERVWVSPYNYVQNNPIRRIDPTGAIDDDYTAKRDGSVEYRKTGDSFDKFFVEDEKGNATQIAQLDKIQLSNGTTLVKFPGDGIAFTKDQTNNKDYVQPTLAAAVFGASNEYFNETGLKVQFTQLNTIEGGHSGHGGKGTNVDARYANKNGNVNEPVWTNGGNFDLKNSQLLVDKFTKYGFNQPGGLSILTENAKGNGPALDNTRFVDGKGVFHHKHHIHLQRYNYNNVKTTKP